LFGDEPVRKTYETDVTKWAGTGLEDVVQESGAGVTTYQDPVEKKKNKKNKKAARKKKQAQATVEQQKE